MSITSATAVLGLPRSKTLESRLSNYLRYTGTPSAQVASFTDSLFFQRCGRCHADACELHISRAFELLALMWCERDLANLVVNPMFAALGSRPGSLCSSVIVVPIPRNPHRP